MAVLLCIASLGLLLVSALGIGYYKGVADITQDLIQWRQSRYPLKHSKYSFYGPRTHTSLFKDGKLVLSEPDLEPTVLDIEFIQEYKPVKKAWFHTLGVGSRDVWHRANRRRAIFIALALPATALWPFSFFWVLGLAPAHFAAHRLFFHFSYHKILRP